MSWNYLVSEPVLLIIVLVVVLCGLAIIGVIVWMIWDRFRPRMTKGIVCSKKFVPEHNSISYLPLTTITPQGGITTNYVPYYNSSDDEWLITIEGEFRGKKRREKYSVTKEFYDQVQIGSFVDFDKKD